LRLSSTPLNSDLCNYRQLLKNVATVYIANSICCSSELLLFFTVHMDVFLQLLSYGCCVDIKHYALYNIVSNVVRLDETDISLLL